MLWLFLAALLSFDPNIEKIDRLLSQNGVEHISIQKLNQGLTNENYLANSYFVRCAAHQGDLLGASLEQEWQATQMASTAELAPRIVFYAPEESILVTEFIQSKPVDLRIESDRQKFCALIRKLHSLDVTLTREFSPFDCIQSYLKNIQTIGGAVPAVYFQKIMPRIEAMTAPGAKVPCHLDLHKGNVLNDGDRMYLIDWEYAAMGDPLFDLATAASADFYTDAEMFALLKTYLTREPTEEEISYFVNMRILADARWALWSYLQAKISPIIAPFTEQGDAFTEQCLLRVSS